MKMEEASANEYLRPTATLDFEHERVQRFVADVRERAAEGAERAYWLFYRVRDELAYSVWVPFSRAEYYRASTVIARGRGNCLQKACVLCACGRAVGIPSRLSFAHLRSEGALRDIAELLGGDQILWDASVEFYIRGRWVRVTPAYDKDYARKHNIAPTMFDGWHDVRLPTSDLDGRPYLTYVEEAGVFDDLPLTLVLDGYREVYGAERIDRMARVVEAELQRRDEETGEGSGDDGGGVSTPTDETSGEGA